MDGHFNLRDARVLVALTAALLVGALLMMLSCAQQGGVANGSVGTNEVRQPVDDSEGLATQDDGEKSQLEDKDERGADGDANALDTASDPADSESSQDAGTERDRASDREPEPVAPADLKAGDELSVEDVERAGGAKEFFWVEPITDTVFARMEGKSFGADCTVPREDLRYLRLLHVDAEGHIKVGELVVHRKVADEVLDIFLQLYEAGYPIRKMHLVDDYDASDDASCADDNTSGFNYRLIAGTSELSNHAHGLAIDINPFENPYCIWSRGIISPDGSARFADRSLREPYMIHSDDLCYQLFVSYGWSWGGNWSGSVTDYQHFEKPDAL